MLPGKSLKLTVDNIYKNQKTLRINSMELNDIVIISAVRVSVSNNATVLFPETHPPVSPGLMRRVFSLFLMRVKISLQC